MSQWPNKILALGLTACSLCLADVKHYVTTVQIAVKEPTPELAQRSQNIVTKEIKQAFETWPQLQGRRYDVKRQGDELLLTLLSQQDMQTPIQQAVFAMIRNLNGKVSARGQTRFYRTIDQHPIRGFLKVVVSRQDLNGEWIEPERDDDEIIDIPAPPQSPPHPQVHLHGEGRTAEVKSPPEVHVVSISAMAVRLRDVLKEMQRKVGNLSYLVPGECMNRRVSWSFGEDGKERPRQINAVMAQLATFLGLRHEQTYGTHIFQGNCINDPDEIRPEVETFEGLPGDPWGVTDVSLEQGQVPHPQAARVFIPLMPLTY